ncbi:MAG: hypothetical protein QOC74_2423, partial [Pseudonocardiales bacterium]|nr:hypothetical protein [Pseudonocardiales bacterium]
MIELLGRHRNRRPARWGVCVAAAALLGTVPFAGSALADDESEDSRSGSRSSKLAGPPANLVEGTPCTVGTVA